jgi:hypothetical protein
MFHRLLIVVVVASLAAIALMISRSSKAPVQPAAQFPPPIDSDEKRLPQR